MNQSSLEARDARAEPVPPLQPPAAESMEAVSIATTVSPVAADVATTSSLADREAAWDEAFLRVESYLHAHQINSRLILNRLTAEMIEEARARAIERPQESPVSLAMEVVRDRMARWFGKIFVAEKWVDEKFRGKGRLALIMAEMPKAWAHRFLNDEPLSPEITESLLNMELQPGPEIRLSKMAPAALEFGFGDTDEKSTATPRWSLHPAVGVCVVILSLMGAAWIASH